MTDATAAVSPLRRRMIGSLDDAEDPGACQRP